jgi:hypothetical protein
MISCRSLHYTYGGMYDEPFFGATSSCGSAWPSSHPLCFWDLAEACSPFLFVAYTLNRRASGLLFCFCAGCRAELDGCLCDRQGPPAVRQYSKCVLSGSSSEISSCFPHCTVCNRCGPSHGVHGGKLGSARPIRHSHVRRCVVFHDRCVDRAASPHRAICRMRSIYCSGSVLVRHSS